MCYCSPRVVRKLAPHPFLETRPEISARPVIVVALFSEDDEEGQVSRSPPARLASWMRRKAWVDASQGVNGRFCRDVFKADY